MPTIKVRDGVEIFYEELGSGDRYVLSTQVGHGKYSMERELAKRGFHVLLLTNRGFGRSTHVTEDYGDYWYDRFAQDVIDVADAFEIDTFAYSGGSHGAGTGWHVVLNYPERVKCFFAVVPGPHNLDEGRISMRTMEQQGKLINHCFRFDTQDARLLERRRQEDEANLLLRQSPDYESIYNSKETRAIDYGRPLRYLGTEEKVQEALRRIKTPVLILGGERDTISRPDLMLRSAACLENCKLVIYSSFGHALDICEEMADEAERFYLNVEKTGYYYTPVVNQD